MLCDSGVYFSSDLYVVRPVICVILYAPMVMQGRLDCARCTP